MSIVLTSDQVLALAPDASSASAGKKLGNTRTWQNLGQNSSALWGECQGSALYQVKVDLSTLTAHCSCPSRKFPCKHSLGLLLLAAGDPSSIPIAAESPAWVVTWLAKRQGANMGKQSKEAQPSGESVQRSHASQLKRAEKRVALVAKGLDSLDLWLNDLVRNGLANVQTQPASFWESKAAQMVDAQAPGIAGRLRLMSGIPNSLRDWPAKLLEQLGRLALLTHAYRRIDLLDVSLQEDVRQLIGWTLTQEEVAARGETVSDDWMVLGQTLNDEEKVRVQRTWLYGTRSQRRALLLQFSAAGAPFPEIYPLGSHQQADLLFWPGAYPQRARLIARRGEIAPLQGQLPGEEHIDTFLAGVAAALACQPWTERFLCVLRGVTPVCTNSGDAWYVRDSRGDALPLAKGVYWQMLALSGGYPIDLAAEWNGETLLPIGMMAHGAYFLQGRTLQ
ncbi:MAG: SWIM zinc finger family protein [Ktedonobacteraceae bacterium]